MTIKKTVVINQIADEFIRKLWAVLVQEGYNASYSTAVNMMILGHVMNVDEERLSKNTKKELLSFLEDDEYYLNFGVEDYADEMDDIFYKKHKEREIHDSGT